MQEKYVGDGQVYLIAGGNKIYTDIAARFVRSERPVKEIIESPYSPQIVRNILESGHGAALEFDYFIFGVEGYSRVCETQLVRKRMASYLIKSGRQELNGKREYSVVIPEVLKDTYVELWDPPQNQWDTGGTIRKSLKDILYMLEAWYQQNLKKGYKEEDLRYFKPQATEFKAIIGMNINGLRNWLTHRMCRTAQAEIRDLATKMYKCVKDVAPDLMEGAGPHCVAYGYCTEGRLQHPDCKGKVYTKEEALKILKNQRAIDKDNNK